MAVRYHAFTDCGFMSSYIGAHKLYASAAIGHREPGRSDIKENIKGEMIPIKPESMLDIEVGYQFSTERFTASANVYLMEYKDMLLETGKLSTSGYAIKENVGRGWRRGVELAAGWKPAAWLRFDGNLTLSTNRLRSFTAYLADLINEGNYILETYNNTPMLLSPSVVGMGLVELDPFQGWPLTLSGKYVGKQYWDNTGHDDRCIPAYYVFDLSLSHSFPLPTGSLGVSFYVNNLLNREYYASAWVYRAWSEGEYLEAGFYPQATRNGMIKLTYSF